MVNDFYSIERKKHIALALAKYPKAKVIAVNNFAGTAPLDPCPPFGPKAANSTNLYSDAKLYKWNQATVDAIKFALDGIYKEAGM